MRCLRRGTGAARSRAPHRLREDAVAHRRPGLLTPPRHQGRLVNAGVVTEIKPGSGPVMAVPQGMSAAEP